MRKLHSCLPWPRIVLTSHVPRPGGAPGWRFQTKSDAGAMVMLRPPAVADDIEIKTSHRQLHAGQLRLLARVRQRV